MADSNLIDLHVGLNSRLKLDYGFKTTERKDNETKDRSFPMRLKTFLYLLQCSAIGAFVFCLIDLLFRVVE
jgi:hypothetical protein